MVQGNGQKKSYRSDYKTYSCKSKIIEKFVIYDDIRTFYIQNTRDVEKYLKYSYNPENTLMHSINKKEEYKVYQWEIEHAKSIGTPFPNSRENLLLICF
jgi:hypothetical protein